MLNLQGVRAAVFALCTVQLSSWHLLQATLGNLLDYLDRIISMPDWSTVYCIVGKIPNCRFNNPDLIPWEGNTVLYFVQYKDGGKGKTVSRRMGKGKEVSL